jgi:hypothetical protein
MKNNDLKNPLFNKIYFKIKRLWLWCLMPHFQQYFSYIVVVSFIGGENHRPATSDWQTLSHNVVSSTPRNERD